MLFSHSFVLGLYAYLRQAELSLHRADEPFSATMREYYDARLEPVERKLGRRARLVGLVEHLNQASHLTTRSLTELAGARWPELD